MNSRACAVAVATVALAVLTAGCGSGLVVQQPGAGLARTPQGEEYVADEILAQVRSGVSADDVARSVGARVSPRIPGIDVHVLRVPADALERVLAMLEQNPLVEYAERNGTVRALADPNDPYDHTTGYNSSHDGCVTR